jgi:hypothetical protein
LTLPSADTSVQVVDESSVLLLQLGQPVQSHPLFSKVAQLPKLL